MCVAVPAANVIIEDDTLSLVDALLLSVEGVGLMERFIGKMLISCLDTIGSKKLVSVGMRNVGTHPWLHGSRRGWSRPGRVGVSLEVG